MKIARARNSGSVFCAYFSAMALTDSASIRACAGAWTPRGRSQWAWPIVLGSSRRVSSLIDFLSPHVLLADPTLPLPPALTPGGMRALAHLACQGDRKVHGARPASRRLPADPPV